MDYAKEIETLKAKKKELEAELSAVTLLIANETTGSDEHKRLSAKELAIRNQIAGYSNEIAAATNKEMTNRSDSLFLKIKAWSALVWVLWAVHPRFLLWRHHYVRNYSTTWVDSYSHIYPLADDLIADKQLKVADLFKTKHLDSHFLFYRYKRSLASLALISCFVGIALCPYNVYASSTEIVETYFPLFRKYRYNTDEKVRAQFDLPKNTVASCPWCKTSHVVQKIDR